MMCLAKSVCVFKKRDYKIHSFKTTKKAQRFLGKCKRKGWDAQLIY